MSKKRRVRGEGTISFDSERQVWFGQLDLGKGPDGRRRRLTVRDKSRPAVAAKLREKRREAEDGIDLGTRQSLTVEGVVRKWLDKGAPGPKGVKQASTLARVTRRCEDHVIPGVGSVALADLRPEHVEAWLAIEASTGQKHRTLIDYRADLRQVLNWARRRRLVTWNAAKEAVIPEAAPSVEKTALTRKEREQLYEALVDDPKGPYLVLLAELGIRPGEADGLSWDAVDLDGDAVYIEAAMKRGDGGVPLGVGAPKTAASRRGIELTARASAALRQQRRLQAEQRLAAGEDWGEGGRWDGLVFLSGIGTPFHPSHVRRSLTAACKRAEIPRVTPYELRHTATTILAEDAPIELVADQLGHVDTSMVQRVYRHRPAVVRTAANVERNRRTS